jgi:hypothetical protein
VKCSGLVLCRALYVYYAALYMRTMPHFMCVLCRTLCAYYAALYMSTQIIVSNLLWRLSCIVLGTLLHCSGY